MGMPDVEFCLGKEQKSSSLQKIRKYLYHKRIEYATPFVSLKIIFSLEKLDSSDFMTIRLIVANTFRVQY